MKDKSRYILDANVLLYDSNALMAFPDAEVIIPITTIEEIDQFKTEMSETGRNARLVSKTIDQYRQTGNLSQGLRQANGSIIRVHLWNGQETSFPKELDLRRSGNRVLATALQMKRQGVDNLVLVSQDTNLRIKANALGIDAVGYEGEHALATELYMGFRFSEVSAGELAEVRRENTLRRDGRIFPNEGLIFQNRENPADYTAFRFDAAGGQFLAIRDFSAGIWNCHPRNPQQALALEILLDPEITVVTLMGKAGTGKTLLALAAGLRLALDENVYTKMLVSRPIFPMGRDLGYLPGTAEEKLEPWMQPIFDNLEYLISAPVSKHHPSKGYQALLDQGLVNIEPLTYIRGRSIPNQFMIVDEAQNLTPHEIKTIITRVGTGTKIVLTGDPYQIDNPYVDFVSNGLSHVVERFKDKTLAGHVTFIRGERSPLAELAADIL